MNIVFSSNTKLFPQVKRLMANINHYDNDVNYYLLTFDILEANKYFDDNINIIDMNNYEYLKSNIKHISADANSRLYIPRMFSDMGIDKVLYLDLDIVVNHSLKELYETDITNYQIAAARWNQLFGKKWLLDRKSQEELDLYLKNKDSYINSGILLINTNKSIEPAKNAIELLKRLELKSIDEDAINFSFNNIKYIDPKWNRSASILLYLAFNPIRIFKKSYILHMNGIWKHWNIAKPLVYFVPSYFKYKKYLNIIKKENEKVN